MAKSEILQSHNERHRVYIMIKFDSSSSYNSNMKLFIAEQYNLHITLSVLEHFEISL